ncbi:MAG: hypothetical protein VX640_08140 [Pseudomonadota bacterium]|nr:hypothetical protein [Pseudomonadota bacterium]
MSQNHISLANEPGGFFWSGGGAKSLITHEGVATGEAAKPATGSRPADLRLHFGNYFVRIIAGKERRSPDRIRKERKENPAFTLRNLPLILAIWLLSSCALLYFLSRTMQILSQM